MLESAESDLIRQCKKNQLKKRDQEEKKRRKELRTNKPTKAERLQRQKVEDEEAKRRAETEQGISYGDHEETPHNAEQVAAEGTETNEIEPHGNGNGNGQMLNPFAVLDNGILKVGQGLKGGANKLGRAGAGMLGGISAIGQGVDNELERSGGFHFVTPEPGPSANSQARTDDRPNAPTDRRVQILDNKPKQSFATERSQDPSEPYGKESMQQELNPKHYGNTVRKLENVEDLYDHEETRWWQFWKPPSGGYASPVPQGAEKGEYPFTDQRSLWTKIKQHIPFMGEEEEKIEYPPFVNEGQEEDYQEREGAEWEKWIKPKDRPHHRLAIFEWTPGWLPGLPMLNKKVDTIYWCRKELARWNVEIEEDQKNTERFPIMTSAFIQFNNQVAAHMACQSAIHHVPKTMAPRMVEISPDDVIWDNMAMSWWMQWTRVLLACGFVFGMILLWTFPIAFSAGLASIDDLISKYEWLSFLRVNEKVHDFVKLAAGVLPPLLLAILLALVPVILNFVAEFQGVKTGSARSEWVQTYYFFCKCFRSPTSRVSLANSHSPLCASLPRR